MGRDSDCRICEKKYASSFANLFDSKVKVHGCENYIISYFEAIQQLTGMEIDYSTNVSNNICSDCQKQIKLAYRIRGELIKALSRKSKPKIQVYQIVSKNPDGNVAVDGSVVHEELVEITEVDEDFNVIGSGGDGDIDPIDTSQQVFVRGAKKSESKPDEIEIDFLQDNDNENENENENEEPELMINDSNDDQEDAVSFLLDKKELFEESGANKGGGQRRHKCDVCEKTFMRKSNLVDHLRLHANVRLFRCEYCSKEFVQAGNYRSHLRIHTKERPYKCSMCPKTYNQSSALKVHIRSHTNEKNYICATCQKGFTNSSDLNKHMRVHDPNLKIKCEHCDKTFAQRVNLRNHVARHHSNAKKK